MVSTIVIIDSGKGKGKSKGKKLAPKAPAAPKAPPKRPAPAVFSSDEDDDTFDRQAILDRLQAFKQTIVLYLQLLAWEAWVGQVTRAVANKRLMWLGVCLLWKGLIHDQGNPVTRRMLPFQLLCQFLTNRQCLLNNLTSLMNIHWELHRWHLEVQMLHHDTQGLVGLGGPGVSQQLQQPQPSAPH